MHRRQFLLSGLLTCGSCGGAYTIVARDRCGGATRRGKGTCDNGQTIMRQHVEARVLGALKARMLTPELVEEFVRAFTEELATLQRDATSRHDQLATQLAATDRRLQGVLRAIEDGAWSDTLRARLHRLQELERRKGELTVALAGLEHPPQVRLHPNAAAIYAAQVAELEASLNAPEVRAEAADMLRS